MSAILSRNGGQVVPLLLTDVTDWAGADDPVHVWRRAAALTDESHTLRLQTPRVQLKLIVTLLWNSHGYRMQADTPPPGLWLMVCCSLNQWQHTLRETPLPLWTETAAFFDLNMHSNLDMTVWGDPRAGSLHCGRLIKAFDPVALYILSIDQSAQLCWIKVTVARLHQLYPPECFSFAQPSSLRINAVLRGRRTAPACTWQRKGELLKLSLNWAQPFYRTGTPTHANRNPSSV